MYPLRSSKIIDFKIWWQCVEIIKSNLHLTKDGLEKWIELKGALHLGLSSSLKKAFPYVIPMIKPKSPMNLTPLPPDWISGFFSGEASFFCTLSAKHVLTVVVKVGLHIRDLFLLELIQSFFNGIGLTYIRNNAAEWSVNSNSQLPIILTHFEKHPLTGLKSYNYGIWLKIVNLKLSRKHLTMEGRKSVLELKGQLNVWNEIEEFKKIS